MGARGPTKTPTSVLKLAGSWRAKQREETEPKPEPGRVEDTLRFLAKNHYWAAMHCLERESGITLPEESKQAPLARSLVMNGEWNAVLSLATSNGAVAVGDDELADEVIKTILRQQYLETVADPYPGYWRP